MENLLLFIEDDEELLLFQDLFNSQNRNLHLQKRSKPFSLALQENDFCWTHFRFLKADLIRLRVLMGLPHKINCRNTVVSGTEALCILLKRLSYPNRYWDMMHMFSRSPSELSKIFNWTVKFILNKFGHLLTDLNQPFLSLDAVQTYCDAIFAKGSPYRECFGFLDETVRAVYRSKINQREYYNGHKRVHAIKFQSLILPNGLIANLFGATPGRRHDAHLLDRSGILPTLEARFCSPQGRPYFIYGDPAYPLRRHLIMLFKGHNLTRARRLCNRRMSSVRELVEWGFNKMLQIFAFLDFKKNLKIGFSPVDQYYKVGTILANCHTCVYGSETSKFFNCSPPTLEEYLISQ